MSMISRTVSAISLHPHILTEFKAHQLITQLSSIKPSLYRNAFPLFFVAKHQSFLFSILLDNSSVSHSAIRFAIASIAADF
jgi:hypothetical protein